MGFAAHKFQSGLSSLNTRPVRVITVPCGEGLGPTSGWRDGGRRTMLMDKGDGNVKRDAIDADAKQYHIDLRWYLVKIYFVKSLKYYGYIEVSCQKLN